MNLDKLKGFFPLDKNNIVSTLIKIAVVALVVWLIIRFLKNSGAKLLNRIDNDEYVRAVDRRTGNENGGTYTDAEYTQMADRLYAAMNGPGTDENAVKAVLEMIKNDSDWARLVKAFGLRDSSYNPFDSPCGLEQWIVGDFSSGSSAMNEYVNQPLRNNGVNKQF